MSFLKDGFNRLFSRSDAKPEPRADAQTGLPGELISGSRASTTPYSKAWSLKGVDTHSNKDHRELRTEYDPRAYLWVIEIARTVWADGFGFVDKDGTPLDEMQPVLDELTRLRFPEHMMRACIEDRKHGWSVVYKVYSGSRVKLVSDPDSEEWGMESFMGDPSAMSDTPAPAGRGPPLWLETLPTKTLQVVKLDALNRPEILRYISETHTETPQTSVVMFDIHATRLWWNNPRPKDRHWEGYTALAPIWEILCMIGTIESNMAWNSGKVGFYKEIWHKQGSLTDSASNSMKAAQQAGGPRRFEMVKEGSWRVEMLAPPIGDSQFDVMLDKAYEALSSGTGLTTARWKGAQAGQLEGSRTNLRLERAVMSAIQASYEPLIRSVVEELFPGQYRDYYIDWTRDEQLDDLERAELAQTKVSTAIQILQIGTIEEARTHVGLVGDLSLEETAAYAQMQVLKEMGAQGQGQDNQDGSKPSDKPTREDAYQARADAEFTRFVAHWEAQGYSRRAIVNACGMSSHTLYDWLSAEKGGLKSVDLQL